MNGLGKLLLIASVIFGACLSNIAFAEKPKSEGKVVKQSDEDEMLSDICDGFENIYKAKKEIAFEKHVARQSGASNLSSLNDSGRKVVRNKEEVKELVAKFKRKYKSDPAVDRCSFMDGLSEKELAEAFKP